MLVHIKIEIQRQLDELKNQSSCLEIKTVCTNWAGCWEETTSSQDKEE